ncbi:MAG: tetratricopeptide repeat protein [Candidatus Heimdallarchaeota archaeon]|nr:tetratricopeptide repeat protein [Candidatus Heimdallarchaeota archaeon]
MIQEIDFFTKYFPMEYLNTIEVEQKKLQEENELIAYLKTFADVLSRVVLDESAFPTFKKGFSQKELNHIIKMTLRLLYFSLEAKGIIDNLDIKLLEENEEPVIKSWYIFLFMGQKGIDQQFMTLLKEWEKIKEIDHTKDIGLLLDKLDVLLFLREVAGYKLSHDETEKYAQLFYQTLNSTKSRELLSLFYETYGTIVIAFTKMAQGKTEEAKIIIDQALKNAKQLDNSFIKAIVFNVFGVYLAGEGYLEKALQQYQLALDHAKKISHTSHRAIVALVNIGDVYMRMGKFDEALEITNKTIQLNPNVFVLRLNKAYIKTLKGKFKESLREVERILVDFPVETIDKNYYFFLQRIKIESFIELNKFESAEQVITELEQIIHDTGAEQFRAYLFYFQGLIEVKKVNLTSAKQLFLQTIELSYDTVDGLNLRIKAEFQLSIVLLNSYKFSENKQDLQKAMALIETVIKAAEEQDDNFILSNALIIHARMYDILEEEKKAINDLKRAAAITEEYGLTTLTRRVKEQLALLERQKEQISSKQKTTGLLGYLAKSLRFILSFERTGKMKEIPAKIYGLTVAAKSGIALYSHYFDEKMETDDQLVSGLLTAVESFIMEVFIHQSSGGSLKSITHENITILLEGFMERYTMIFFASADTADIRSKLIQLVDKIETEIVAREMTPEELEDLEKIDRIIEPLLTDFFPKKMIP